MMRQPTLSRLFSLVCLNDGRESRTVPSGQRREDVKLVAEKNVNDS